jgi:hypothetical protein
MLLPPGAWPFSAALSCPEDLRQAYDYWQDQPGSYPLRARLLSRSETVLFPGFQHTKGHAAPPVLGTSKAITTERCTHEWVECLRVCLA